MIENLTLETVPQAVIQLFIKLEKIEELLLEKREQETNEQSETFLNIQEAAKFLNLTVPTVYSKVSKRELPCMKRGKKLYFSSLSLTQYIKEGRKKSNDEIEADAESFLKNKGGKK